jgi:hypothetical protein
MEFRHLGSSGLQVSALSLGRGSRNGGQVGEGSRRECMGAASMRASTSSTMPKRTQRQGRDRDGRVLKNDGLETL